MELIRKVKSITKKKLEKIYLRHFGNFYYWAPLYYLIFSKSFVREQNSVLTGKMSYIDKKEENNSNFYLLVRNIHRIEKGLSMMSRRKVFARDYIKDTINSFEKFVDLDDPQIHWADDILNQYFNVVELDNLLECEKKRFQSLSIRRKSFRINNTRKLPYKSIDRKSCSVDFNSFFKLCRQRRSVRWFLDKDVPRDLIDKAITAAIQSPSACNRQPFEYIVIDNKEILEKAVHIPMGTKGYADNIKTFVVVVGNLDAYFNERDRHLIYIDASLANMTLMLALETLGLSSCPINWPDIEEKEKQMKGLLNLKNFQRPIMCIGIGYPNPDGLIPASEKRNLNSIRKYV